uniref:NOL8 n=1 Tax=Caenorhabditis tropicalis TaxID=1561998 RepID=A0A1I7UPE8_9PELO
MIDMFSQVVTLVWKQMAFVLNPKKGPKVSAPTPITYETDPNVLERERKLRIQENREKMRKKREKNILKSLEESKAASVKKSKELELLPEDKTQSMTTDSSDSSETKQKEVSQEVTMAKTQDASSKKKESSRSNEELGDIQLVDKDSNASSKMRMLKERAKDAAKKKQVEEELGKSFETTKSESSVKPRTPDDTLRNISSIQMETRPAVQRKKKPEKVDTIGDTTESLMVNEAVVVDPKSNPMYIREFTQHVLRGSVEKSEAGQL